MSGSELEEFFDLSIDLLCIVGVDGYFKRVSPSLERAFGYPRDVLFSRTVFDFTHPDDVERSRNVVARGEALYGFESRVICADGTIRWIEWNTRAAPESGVLYGVGRDTTARRSADEALREARDELHVLATEQAALRRVATLIARETAPEDLFAAVVQEIGEVLGVDATHLGRFEADETVVSVAFWGRYEGVPVGSRWPLDGESVSAQVWRTGLPARMDGYDDVTGAIAAALRELGIRSAIGVPVSVAGRTWGVMTATSKDAEPLPAVIESRLRAFTELLATAIANAEARAEVARLAQEQAALRRVATLVAQGGAPADVFASVTAEATELLDASAVTLARYEGEQLLVIAQRGPQTHVQIGERYPLGGTNAATIVLRTGRTARLDDIATASGTIGDVAREGGARSVVAAPVTVDGRTWGVLVAIWKDRASPPSDTEERMARFAELLGTAVANADGREALTASRARLLAAGDDARRGIVRDLHDGAQQRLVHTIVTLKLAQRALNSDDEDAAALLAEALGTAEQAMVEVRELAHGMLPAALTRGGLRAGVDALVSRLDLPVGLDVTAERLAPDIEASAYFIVAEGLTNVVKHARARRAAVRATLGAGVLALEISDNGVGGADPGGHGLVGVADRVAALGGQLRIESPECEGTRLTVRLPL